MGEIYTNLGSIKSFGADQWEDVSYANTSVKRPGNAHPFEKFCGYRLHHLVSSWFSRRQFLASDYFISLPVPKIFRTKREMTILEVPCTITAFWGSLQERRNPSAAFFGRGERCSTDLSGFLYGGALRLLYTAASMAIPAHRNLQRFKPPVKAVRRFFSQRSVFTDAHGIVIPCGTWLWGTVADKENRTIHHPETANLCLVLVKRKDGLGITRFLALWGLATGYSDLTPAEWLVEDLLQPASSMNGCEDINTAKLWTSGWRRPVAQELGAVLADRLTAQIGRSLEVPVFRRSTTLRSSHIKQILWAIEPNFFIFRCYSRTRVRFIFSVCSRQEVCEAITTFKPGGQPAYVQVHDIPASLVRRRDRERAIRLYFGRVALVGGRTSRGWRLVVGSTLKGPA